MFAVIKRILRGLFGHKPVEPPPTRPPDPYAYRTAPRKRDPYDRGGAVAVLEPDEDEAPADFYGKVDKYSNFNATPSAFRK